GRRRSDPIELGDGAQNPAAMPQQNAEVLEVLLRQITDARERGQCRCRRTVGRTHSGRSMLATRQCLSWHVPSMACRIIRAWCPGAIAQCLHLEYEVHHSAPKLCILGLDPLKESPLIKPRDFRIPRWQT